MQNLNMANNNAELPELKRSPSLEAAELKIAELKTTCESVCAGHKLSFDQVKQSSDMATCLYHIYVYISLVYIIHVLSLFLDIVEKL